MFMNVFEKKESIFFKFLLSYIIILLIALSISFITFFIADNFVKTEINRANEFVLKQVKTSLDDKIVQAQGLDYQLSENSLVFTSIIDDGDSKSDGFNEYKVQQYLCTLMRSNNYIKNIFIYYSKSDSIISKDSKLTSSEFYEAYFKSDKMQYNEWKSLINSKNIRDVIAVYPKEGMKTIAVMQSLPMDSLDGYLAKAVIVFDETKLESLINNSEWLNEGVTAIFNQNNKLLITSNAKYNSIDISKYINKTDLIYDTVNGKKSIIKVFDSSATGCKYISVVPYSIFFRIIQYFRNINFIGIMLFLILGGLTAYILTKKNYNPVKLAINKIREKSNINYSTKDGSELEFLGNILEMTIEEKENLTKRITTEQDILRENFLIKVLTGRILEGSPSKETFSKYNIKLLSNYFTVVLFNVENYEEIYSANRCDEEYSELLGFIIKNILEELTSKKYQGFVVALDKKNYACIINITDSNYEETYSNITKLCEEANDFLEIKFRMLCSVALGDIHSGINGINQAYLEATNAMEYKVILGKGSFITYKSIKNRNSGFNYAYNTKIEQKLMFFIKNSNINVQNTEGIVNEIFDESQLNDTASIEMVKCFIYDTTRTLAKIVDEVCKSSFMKEKKSINTLISCETLSDFKHELVKVINDVCDYIQLDKIENPLGIEVRKFIDENFSDSNINVNMLGERFAISPHHLSKLFKDQLGTSIIDYLCNVRIQNSKKLLKESDLGISEIANRVGFLSSSVYIRSFKKYEGITPGAFREI